MKILSKNDILKAPDIKTEEVDVTAWWGGAVLVRGMTGAQRDRFEGEQAGLAGAERFKNLRARWCAECIVDEKGDRLFSEDEVVALGEKSAAPLDVIFDAAMRLSGIDSKAAENAAKNSNGANHGASISN